MKRRASGPHETHSRSRVSHLSDRSSPACRHVRELDSETITRNTNTADKKYGEKNIGQNLEGGVKWPDAIAGHGQKTLVV